MVNLLTDWHINWSIDWLTWTVAHGSIAEGAMAMLLSYRSHGPWTMNMWPLLNFVINQTLANLIDVDRGPWLDRRGKQGPASLASHGLWAMNMWPIINLVMNQTMSNYLWIHNLLNKLTNGQRSWPVVLSPMEAKVLLVSPWSYEPWCMNIQPLINLIMNQSWLRYSFIGILINQSTNQLIN